MIAKTTRTARNTRPATTISPIAPEGLQVLPDHRGGPVDMQDGHLIAGLENITFVHRPRRPHLAVQLHLTFIAGDPVEDQCVFSSRASTPVRSPFSGVRRRR